MFDLISKATVVQCRSSFLTNLIGYNSDLFIHIFNEIVHSAHVILWALLVSHHRGISTPPIKTEARGCIIMTVQDSSEDWVVGGKPVKF